MNVVTSNLYQHAKRSAYILLLQKTLSPQGQITLPTDRTEITGGELVLVVGNALFDQPRNSLPSEMRRHVEQNTEDAISILHKLLTGLDVNVKFSGLVSFVFVIGCSLTVIIYIIIIILGDV